MTSPVLQRARLLETLDTVRHLPAGTELAPVPNPALRELLPDLLALPDDTDPLTWIQHERGELALGDVSWRLQVHRGAPT